MKNWKISFLSRHINGFWYVVKLYYNWKINLMAHKKNHTQKIQDQVGELDGQQKDDHKIRCWLNKEH